MAGRKGAKRPSIFEVAKLAGVSHQTVSRVINDSPNVSPATREKVELVIAELGYRPSNSARSLASNRTHTIDMIAGGQRFYGPVTALSSIEATARAHTMFVSVAMVHEAECTQSELGDRPCPHDVRFGGDGPRGGVHAIGVRRPVRHVHAAGRGRVHLPDPDR